MSLLFLLRTVRPSPKVLSLCKLRPEYYILKALNLCSLGLLQQMMVHRILGLATVRVRVWIRLWIRARWWILLLGLWRPLQRPQ